MADVFAFLILRVFLMDIPICYQVPIFNDLKHLQSSSKAESLKPFVDGHEKSARRGRKASSGRLFCADRSGAETDPRAGSIPGQNIKRSPENRTPLGNKISARRGSNPRSSPWQGDVLPAVPLSHIRLWIADAIDIISNPRIRVNYKFTVLILEPILPKMYR